MAPFEIVVIGAGVTGSAALLALARRGVAVLGLERFAPGHDKGSSHGISRIIRYGYYEHPSYVPLVRHADRLWRELEQATGRRLRHRTGIIEIGAPDAELIEGTLNSSRLHDLPHNVLDARDVMRRFPAFEIPEHFIGVWQPDGGWLEAEPAIEAQVELAKASGAELRTGVTVRAIEAGASGVRIVTDHDSIDAGQVIVAAGPWLRSLVPNLPLRVTRQVIAWFDPLDPALFVADRFPIFMLETKHGIHYGFPPHTAGLKIAKHFHGDETVDPDSIDCAISARDEALIRDAIAEYLPAANGRLRSAKTCLYTMTPDGDFILDRVPAQPNVIVASPCSGHGFKFAPVIGEILADLATAKLRHMTCRGSGSRVSASFFAFSCRGPHPGPPFARILTVARTLAAANLLIGCVSCPKD